MQPFGDPGVHCPSIGGVHNIAGVIDHPVPECDLVDGIQIFQVPDTDVPLDRGVGGEGEVMGVGVFAGQEPIEPEESGLGWLRQVIAKVKVALLAGCGPLAPKHSIDAGEGSDIVAAGFLESAQRTLAVGDEEPTALILAGPAQPLGRAELLFI